MTYKKENFKPIPLEYTFNSDNPFRLMKNLQLRLHDGNEALIPKGFNTDFASVPKFLWSLFPPYDSKNHDIMAFLIHDYMYWKGYYLSWPDKNKIPISRAFADYEMMWQQKKVGVSPWRYKPMYWAVRLFAGGLYDYYDKYQGGLDGDNH